MDDFDILPDTRGQHDTIHLKEDIQECYILKINGFQDNQEPRYKALKFLSIVQIVTTTTPSPVIVTGLGKRASSSAESRFLEEPRNRVPRKIFMKNRKKLYLSYEMLHFG